MAAQQTQRAKAFSEFWKDKGNEKQETSRFCQAEYYERLSREVVVSLKAGKLVGKLYDALLKQYINPDEKSLAALNVLCVRLVFCLYAEKANLFEKRTSFEDYIKSFSPEHLRKGIIDLFKALNTKKEDRDKYEAAVLEPFPYADGGLFMAEDIEVPSFTQEIVDVLVNDCCAFDWSEISPTIFGALFESTLNPETRRKGGMHYTSIPNIHKVIDPLFMDSLNAEFDSIVNKPCCSLNTKKWNLMAFKQRLSELKFLDPACGSGNFLTETYLSLRRLENKIIDFINDGDKHIGFKEFISVKISQFYGIEINDFAVTVAKTALWIAECQMTKETEKILGLDIDFLPLKSNSNIVEGNAMCINWTTLKPEDSSIYTMPDTLFFGAIADTSPVKHYDYIIGNPPFVGYKYLSDRQKDELKHHIPNFRAVDYVAGWYYKAAEVIRNTNIKCAYVSTNSVCQGSHIQNMWYGLFANGLEIDFAWRPFVWESESTDKAHVHCVIVGFSHKNAVHNQKVLFDENGNKQNVERINAYLSDAKTVVVKRRGKPLCDVPDMTKGAQLIDGGNFMLNSDEEKDVFLKKYPQAEPYVYKYYNAKDFLESLPQKYCLYLKDCPPNILSTKGIKDKVTAVYKYRANSDAETTRILKETPTLYFQSQVPEKQNIVVPVVSSGRRNYIPMAFMPPKNVYSNALFYIDNASIYHFGVLTSKVHIVWVNAVCGRMKSDFRYSNDIIYNNFVWPNPTAKQKDKIEKAAQKIIDARELYYDNSLSDLYDPLLMPLDLRKAHRENDLAVIAAYGWDKNISEDEIVEKLFELYQQKNTAK